MVLKAYGDVSIIVYLNNDVLKKLIISISYLQSFIFFLIYVNLIFRI